MVNKGLVQECPVKHLAGHVKQCYYGDYFIMDITAI